MHMAQERFIPLDKCVGSLMRCAYIFASVLWPNKFSTADFLKTCNHHNKKLFVHIPTAKIVSTVLTIIIVYNNLL